ncbi:ABC transporter substrate-binding protein [Natrarchaeobius oligotrophus]|uniref:Cobalamin-binding protein n=1 Tax=Natrarchaeobius chitinivorans TaxID=1679083 RepID=A0A3N6MGX9_NATCH|nr:ABC transporter substrate-binding protein [Natrarchaeobius chitinivorans]RQH03354.1 cobalamin-binding protein [Natrarchaeobius chitinivorans]
MRIVTTLPAATETVAALGLEPVGVSHECDYPPGVESLPSITRSRVDADAESGEIDRQVLEAAADGGVYDVDVETLAAVEPELIVTQDACDVCAVDEVIVEEAVERIAAERRASSARAASGFVEPEILTTDPHTVDDVLSDVERVGRATDRLERARVVRGELETRIDRVRSRTAALDADDRPRVAIFDWTDPVMIAGHWTAELVGWAGGEYGLADVGERSRPREWDEIREYDPEVVIVAPCGFSLAQIAENRRDLVDRDGWTDLAAVRAGRVWAMDGNHYLNRPGPRLVDALEVLARIVQPTLFEGIGASDGVDGNSTDGADSSAPLAEVAVPFDRLDDVAAVNATPGPEGGHKRDATGGPEP